MDGRRVLFWIVVALILFWVVSAPGSAAATVNGLLEGLGEVGSSLVTFFSGIAPD